MDNTTIQYLSGQLKAAHEKKPYLTLVDMAIDYKDRQWTKNKNIIFALCYLGVASGTIPPFKERNGIIVADFIEDKKKINTTRPFYVAYGPNDPNFNEKHPFIDRDFEEFEIGD